MGSKKHKERDRESRRKRKHSRDRDRNRDRDREKSSVKEKRHERERDRFHSDDSDHDFPSPRKIKKDTKLKEERSKEETVKKKSTDFEDGEIHVSKNSGGEISLSVADTNKIRAKLGLKLLDEKPVVKQDGDATSLDNKEEIFVKTENISMKKQTEIWREKIVAQREKRQMQRKLKNVKRLADTDSDEDMTSWVKKNRKLTDEKKKAEEREKMLEEMDEEFGVGELVEDELLQTKSKMYSSRDLSGMSVGHAQNLFKEGSSVILTLKDKDVLAEDEDVLENVNLIDHEHAAQNVENKKKLPGYQPYDDPEYDEYGQLIKKELLEKYDEEISGPKKESFRLGSSGDIDIKKQQQLKIIKAKLQQKQADSLTLPAPVLASEFYSQDEMVQFKKRKKKVRKVRKKALRADDFEPLPDSNMDHGSRKSENVDFEKFKENWEKGISNAKRTDDDMEVVVQPNLQITEVNRIDDDDDDYINDVMVEEDQAEADLQLALNKARKLKQKESHLLGLEKVLKDVKKTSDGLDDHSATGNETSAIVMNATAEFCRALGDIPTYGQSGNREDEDELMDLEDDVEEKGESEGEGEGESSGIRGAWNEVEIDETPAHIEQQVDEAPILEEEPVVGLGVAGALQLAQKKGYLDKDMTKAKVFKNTYLEAENYTIEDKNYDDDKVSSRRGDRFISGPVMDFKEKREYKPDIKLEYIDDGGRILNQKEAFRYLSHKFHGKGPGKMKTEKRVKKQEEDVLMRQMSSTDTPLKTLSMLQEKQKETQSPYVVLSGGSKALQSNSLSKVK